MSVVRFTLPLFLAVVAFTQWLLLRARRPLSIEDKARIADAMFRSWWITLAFAGVAQGYVQTQLWISVVLHVAMILVFTSVIYDSARVLVHH